MVQGRNHHHHRRDAACQYQQRPQIHDSDCAVKRFGEHDNETLLIRTRSGLNNADACSDDVPGLRMTSESYHCNDRQNEAEQAWNSQGGPNR